MYGVRALASWTTFRYLDDRAFPFRIGGEREPRTTRWGVARLSQWNGAPRLLRRHEERMVDMT
jgi:hypothetical protein